MHIQINDGQTIFATHLIKQTKGTELPVPFSLPFQLEADGIVCYSPGETERARAMLDDMGITYAVEKLQHAPAHIAKAQGIKYASRSEAIAHLSKDKEPESQRLPNLMKKLAERDAEIVALRAEKDTEMVALKNELTALKGLLQTKGIMV